MCIYIRREKNEKNNENPVGLPALVSVGIDVIVVLITTVQGKHWNF